jgi:hypothetical protein
VHGATGPTGATIGVASTDISATDRLFAAGLGLPNDGAGRYLLGRDVVLAVHRSEAVGRGGPTELVLHGDRTAERAGVLGGVPFRLTNEPLDPPPGTAEAVLGLDHLGVASDDSAGLVAALTSELGFEYESRQIDTQLESTLEVFSSDRYGVVSHTGSARTAGALLVTFLRRGRVDIEILQDIVTAGGTGGSGPGSTTGDNRAISRFVARHGAGPHHLAVRVRDIEPAIARFRDAGINMIDTVGRPGSRRSRIAFLDRRSTGGLVLHLVQRPDP